MKKFSILIILLVVSIYSCVQETSSEKDTELTSLLTQNSLTGNADWYQMPESNDYANIPGQDPKNPVTEAKVILGEMLFFETGIGIKPNKTMSMETYSCSSCHVPEKSFTAGRFQGIADGALGFGEHGEGRLINPWYDGTEVDAQGARPLPVINLAYVKNALWNGSFGSFGMNTGTSAIWGKADTLTKINFENREGLEAAIPRALIVHRQDINKALMDKLGYTNLFNKAFPDVPVRDRKSVV